MRYAFAPVLLAAIWFAYPPLIRAEIVPIEIVVFDAELVDTSAEGEIYGENPAESERLALVTSLLRDGLRDSGRYKVVDTGPLQEQLAKLQDSVRYLFDCNDCELDIARALGARQSAILWVQKVSNLILNLNVVIKDVDSGAVVKTAFVDIRGNTDRSWEHGTRYMLKNRLLADPQGE